MNTIAERINKILNHFSLDLMEFSQKTGVQYNVLTEIIDGMATPSFVEIQKICTIFKSVEARWIILGDGEFLISKKPVNDNKQLISICILEEKLKLIIEYMDEELYRIAAKSLNEKLKENRLKNPTFSTKKHLKLIAFHYAIELEKEKKDINYSSKNQIYKNAALNVREKLNYYNNKFLEYSEIKIYTITTFYFALGL